MHERDDGFEIHVTPTYSGGPATRVINEMISEALLSAHIEKFTIKKVLSPVWSTQWISESGKAKLEAYGIAPPILVPRDQNHVLNVNLLVSVK